MMGGKHRNVVHFPLKVSNIVIPIKKLAESANENPDDEILEAFYFCGKFISRDRIHNVLHCAP